MSYGYTYDAGSSSIATTLLIIYVVYIVARALVSFAAYIFRGIGFYTIAKSQGDSNAWLAFVPFARKYQQGELAGEIQLKTKSIHKTGMWFVGIPIAWGMLSYIIGMIFGISIITKVIRYGLFGYNAYVNLDGEILGVFAFLSIFILFTAVYKIFYMILHILVNTKILSKYTKGNMPLIHSIFTVFIPLYEAICFFIISRKIENEEKKKQQRYAQNIEYSQMSDMESSAENVEYNQVQDTEFRLQNAQEEEQKIIEE